MNYKIILLILTLILTGITQGQVLKSFYVYSESGRKYGLKYLNDNVVVDPQFDFIDCRGISPTSEPGSFFKYKGIKQQY